MKGDTPTLDEYRTGYIAEKHDVSDNCARALQLFELGFSVSGATKHLPVTESTVAGYHGQLMDTIAPDVVMDIHAKYKHNLRFDVWGDRDTTSDTPLTYDDGVADARASEGNVTDRKEQIDPAFRHRERPINRGRDLEEIPDHLITINGGDN